MSADVTCVLKVNVHCQACKMNMMEVLGSVIGVYSVDIDGNGSEGMGLATVFGEVDPNLLLKALARTGTHAEIERVSIRHPMMDQSRRHRAGGYGYGNAAYGLHGSYRPNYYNSGGYGSYRPNYYNSRGRFMNNYDSGVYPDEYPSLYGDAGGYYPGRRYNQQFYYPMGRTMPCGASVTGGGYGPFSAGYGSGYMPMPSSSFHGYGDDHLGGGQNCRVM